MNNQYDDLPPTIVPSFSMSAPNKIIELFSGKYTLQKEQNSIEVEGLIYFAWFPRPRTQFEGKVTNITGDVSGLLTLENGWDLVVNGLKVAEVRFTNVVTTKTVGIPEQTNVKGMCSGEAVLDDKSIPVTKVKFIVPNLRDFYGTITKGALNSEYNSRIRFENEEFEIVLDKVNNFNDLNKLLKSQGGYIILYAGEVTKKTGSINYQDIQKLTECFSTFLTFLNGRRCAPMLLQGVFDEDVKWTCVSSEVADQYMYVRNWPPQYSIEGLSKLWKSFSDLWKQEKDFITMAVHWYVEANSNAGFVEGSIVMAQAALELIYNWLVIERKKLIVGKDAEDISAANKIRLLLAQLSLNPEVPNKFTELQRLVDDNKEPKMLDGVDAFIYIRNAIIHSQQQKRKKIFEISAAAKYEALQMGIWYVEIALLYIFGYKGQYWNRCSGAVYVGDGEELVPYAT